MESLPDSPELVIEYSPLYRQADRQPRYPAVSYLASL